jgi:hypothetical protein
MERQLSKGDVVAGVQLLVEMARASNDNASIAVAIA